MDIDGTYFFTEEVDDPVLARAQTPPTEGLAWDTGPGLVEGETLPEAALQALRSWFGF